MHKTSIVMASLALALSVGPAMAKPFTQLWVFGDSSVDSGSFRVAPYTGDSFVDFYLAPTYPLNNKTGFQKWGIGKPTSNPGLMNSEELALLLGVTALPQNQHGTNYAFSGARNSMPNTSCVVNCGFPNAIPTTQQIASFLKQNKPKATELFYISSGSNDVKYAVLLGENPTPPPNTCGPNAKTYLTQVAQDLASAISSLQQGGAKYIFVANEGAASADSTLDACKRYYQSTIANDLSTLGVVYVIGGRGFKPLIESEPSTFGINLAEGPACMPIPPHIPTAYGLVCSPTSPATRDLQPSLITSEEADDQHYATPAQIALGNYYYCLALFSWPSLFTSPSPKLPYPCSTFSSIIPYTGP
jgi:GDSL-like Lipase/Acylhydrolase